MKNRTQIDESSKRDDGYEIGYFNNDLFWLDESIRDELLLSSYVESRVKLATLNYYLFYECGCDPNVNTLNLETNIKRYSSNNIENYDYWQACLLAFEYIESSLKTINYLQGKSLKEIKGYSHDIERLVNSLPYDVQKELSINCFWLPDDYLTTNFGMAAIRVNEDASFREKITQISLEKGHAYFKKYLRRIYNGMVDIRYSDISNIKNDCNLKFLLEMCKTLDNILETKYEPIRHQFDSSYDATNKYHSMLDGYNKGFVEPTEPKIVENVPTIPLSDVQLLNTKASVDAKYKALKYYLLACNEYDYSGTNAKIENSIDVNSKMDEIITNLNLFRNDISKKSGDGDVWKNYSYYQGCHLASMYIEHALKFIILSSKNETYSNLKENYGHDFKKMYECLDTKDKETIRDNCLLLGHDYLSKAVEQKHTNDRINKNDEEEVDNNSFVRMLELMNDSFKQTRYPHSQNYNLEWKYSLRFMLKFVDALDQIIQNKYSMTPEHKSTISK